VTVLDEIPERVLAVYAHPDDPEVSCGGALARWADIQLAPAKIPWQQRLARWARQQVTSRRGARDYTYTRISRRQYGLPPGSPILPSMVDNEVRAVVAVDTSGSMSDRELAMGLSEIQAVLEQCGLRARAIVCDAEIHEDCEIKSAAELSTRLKGGGGTDFRPIFDRIAKGRMPDVLVFVTDGYGPAPETPPPYGMVWVLVGQGYMPAMSFHVAGGWHRVEGETLDVRPIPVPWSGLRRWPG
jgi:predicted metal-dependent peptidase